MQERTESSEFGRGLISMFLIVTLGFIAATNLPSSPLRDKLMRSGQPYLNALGLDQSWAIFAPDPRRAVIDLRAVVRYDDGSTRTWRIPHDDPVIGTFRDYRWRKWLENVIADANPQLWRPAALWVAGQETRPGRRAVQVTLVRRVAPLQPPGQSPSQLPWQEKLFYTLDITGPR
ncbi:MAG: hypothetical protein QOF77_2327 [Solirubrobacteraceae bacterium]|nr:hypothetical protein [Solirubrobacteraceae bacterium]